MISCIAIDDEPLALQQIVSYIRKTPFLSLAGQYDNAISALEFLQDNQVDLMFVDINMPDLSGMDFVKSMDDGPRVIFTTAYNEYAIEGFKVDAVDYLLKPISYDVFLKAAQKANSRLASAVPKHTVVESKEDFLFIKSEYKIIRIRVPDIKYIESMREYVRIHLIDQNPIMTLISMKKMEQSLAGKNFMRVHRSFIVNLDRVTTIERFRIIFDEKIYIPVSDQYKEQFQEYLNNNFLS
ncbi:MAG: LytTR family DNA-binding domain-containing protein [Cytophagales bacterium]|nr:LytTR family DNA-binding domain-containing protein [Cytophagales bacterium]